MIMMRLLRKELSNLVLGALALVLFAAWCLFVGVGWIFAVLLTRFETGHDL